MMRVVLQRVSRGSVTVENRTIAEIGLGLVILLGVGPDDGDDQIDTLVNKIANLRIFADEQGKINRSILEVGGGAIVVSQFTLYADTRKGRRPSFTDAAPPEVASLLVDRFAKRLNQAGVPTQKGEFGVHMQVEIHNDGPVTIWMER
jgi:D-tyrosyl-tRNA(Tyr) deacylase